MIFNISWGFQKNEYFWGYEDLMDTLGGGGGGSSQSGLFLGVISVHFKVFFKVKVQYGNLFWGVA